MKAKPEFPPRSCSARPACEQKSSRSGASRRSARTVCPLDGCPCASEPCRMELYCLKGAAQIEGTRALNAEMCGSPTKTEPNTPSK